MKQIKKTLLIALLFLLATSQVQARQTLPDGLGYSAIDSNEVGGPTFNYDDISATGTQELLDDDDNVGNIPIGFTFNFYGMDYTVLSIASNGYLFFGLTTNNEYNTDELPIPQPAGTDNWQDPPFIAPWFDDLDPAENADSTFWETLGTAPNRRFVVQYQVPHIDNNTEPFDFEVTLFEGSNEILFQYKVATTTDPGSSNGISATVGLQGKDDVGLNYQWNEGLLTENLAVLLRPPTGPFVGINASNKTGTPGTTVKHTLSIYNRTGEGQDFNLAISGNQWATSVATSTGFIIDGGMATLDLDVVIPELTGLPPLSDYVAIDITGNGVRAIQNIYTQSFPGSRFTNDVDMASGNPSISDDGSRIAFQSQSDLIPGSNPLFMTQTFVVNSDGTGLTQLTSDSLRPSSDPSISGDGSRIAFQSDADLTSGGNPSFRTQIFVINSDGTGLTQLTSDSLRSSFSPGISGDGNRIAFHSSADLTGGNPLFRTQIFVINSDGSGLTQLTSDSLRSSFSPSISGDGSRIAFQSSADLMGGNPPLRTQIFVVNSDGTGLAQLTGDAADDSRNPSISGDGSRVAFQSNADLTSAGNLDNDSYVFAMNTDGNALVRIAEGRRASLSRDGSRVAFETSSDYVAIMNSDGTGTLTEFRYILDADDPSLSEDGAFLAFEGNGETPRDQIYVYEVAKTDSDGDGVSDISEGSAGAGDATLAMAVNLSTGGTVDISVPAGRRLSGVSADTAVNGPAGVAFPFGTVFYRTTSAIGGSVTTTFNFSSALPTELILYKVDASGTYTEIPATQWTKTGANSLDLTLTDGGAFDLDGVANGIIVDPLAVGDFNAPPSAPILISPDNGQTGLGTTVDFQWNASTDANGNAMTYDFFICDNDTFVGTDCGTTTVVAAAIIGLTQLASFGNGLFILGIACMGGLKRKTPALMLMLAAGLVLSACGGGSGGGGGNVVLSHQESGLKAGTTYYWKVVASDGKLTTESEVRTFTTQ
ncbi:MAG: hypothetical protein L3K25_05430 [Gammaproteobacteria bacterium]|nr:hypothetical protein [Gammaproteobacteria bacterium]